MLVTLQEYTFAATGRLMPAEALAELVQAARLALDPNDKEVVDAENFRKAIEHLRAKNPHLVARLRAGFSQVHSKRQAEN